MAPTVASNFASLSSRRLRTSTAAFLTCQIRSAKHSCNLSTVSVSPVGEHWPSTSIAVLRTSGCTSSNLEVIAGRICISTALSLGVLGLSVGVTCCVAPLLTNMLLLRRASGMRPRRAKAPNASNVVRLTSGFQSSRQAFNDAKACCLSPLPASWANTSSATERTSAWESRIMLPTAATACWSPFNAMRPHDSTAAFLTDQWSSVKRSFTKSMYF
mmetsp:Transcript_67676/g.133583  ORF Transcript_67676/g.133583 Transcript_67676/m.133583 type:complete len:215 (+) Transcript_67676:400-1044(+)